MRELRRLAGLVEPGLLALDDACVAREEALALERHPQLGIGLDERTGDPVPHRAGLAGRAAAVDADADVERSLDAGGLQRCERQRAVGGAREVVLERPAVEPRLPVARAKDHARDRRLALPGAEVLRLLCHYETSNVFGA